MDDGNTTSVGLRARAVEDYLGRLWELSVTVQRMRRLGEGKDDGSEGDLKEYGYGDAVRVDCRVDGEARITNARPTCHDVSSSAAAAGERTCRRGLRHPREAYGPRIG